jgi:hypothetical protein
MVALADDTPAADNDGTDHRVRFGILATITCQLQTAAHIHLIFSGNSHLSSLFSATKLGISFQTPSIGNEQIDAL